MELVAGCYEQVLFGFAAQPGQVTRRKEDRQANCVPRPSGRHPPEAALLLVVAALARTVASGPPRGGLLKLGGGGAAAREHGLCPRRVGAAGPSRLVALLPSCRPRRTGSRHVVPRAGAGREACEC